MKRIAIYTDGACKNNPGPGGWCAILTYQGHERMISGGDPRTTNNRMELIGVIEAIKALKEPCEVEIVTDSQYVSNAFNKHWIDNWKRDDFRNRPNSDLWRQLLKVMAQHSVQFIWIKGHNCHPYNERCDKEAVRQSNMY